MNDDYPKIPIQFRDRVASFPESSMGVVRIKLILSDGQKIRDVFIGGDGIIAKIGTTIIQKTKDLDFDPKTIVEVHSEI